jgi:hypothetical protein
MNNLSWLLYFAEVAGKLGSAAEAITIVMIFGSVGVVFWYAMSLDKGFKAIPKPPVKSYLTVFVITLLISILTPSKETIYLIAGSEAGEAVVTSESGQEILNDIRQVIKYQLEVLKKGEVD